MSLVGFQAQNHPQQTAKSGAKSNVDDRATTPEVFGPIDKRYGFTLDVAASPDNAKCELFFTASDDGLAQSWDGHHVWCNPPYSDIRPWVEKAWTSNCPVVVMLLPANRTEQAWWQDLVEPYRDRAGSPLTVEFLRGRIRFIATGDDRIRPNQRPPFGCCLLVWDRRPPQLAKVYRQEALPL